MAPRAWLWDGDELGALIPLSLFVFPGSAGPEQPPTPVPRCVLRQVRLTGKGAAGGRDLAPTLGSRPYPGLFRAEQVRGERPSPLSGDLKLLSFEALSCAQNSVSATTHSATRLVPRPHLLPSGTGVLCRHRPAFPWREAPRRPGGRAKPRCLRTNPPVSCDLDDYKLNVPRRTPTIAVVHLQVRGAP